VERAGAGIRRRRRGRRRGRREARSQSMILGRQKLAGLIQGRQALLIVAACVPGSGVGGLGSV